MASSKKTDPRVADLEAQLKTLKARLDDGARLYADRGQTLDHLSAKVDEIASEVEALKKAGPLAIQAPTPMTSAEAMVALERNPAIRLRVLAPFPRLGLKAGDVVEARQAFASASIMASFVTGGLRLATT